MKKTILSLAAVLTMFASVPAIYASPVVDSASKVSVNKFTSTEPQIKIEHLTTLDVPRNSLSFVDGRNKEEKNLYGIADNIVNKGETKRFHRYQLSKGQKLIATIDWYHKFLSNGTIQNGMDALVERKLKPVQRIEKTIEEDGYYSIDLVAPSNQSGVDQYHIIYWIKVE